MADPLNIEKRKELVLAAIERIRSAEKQWLEAEQNPSSTDWDRMNVKRIFEVEKRYFYVQWENVEALLNG